MSENKADTIHFAFFPSALNAGLVGLALTYTVSLSGTFQFCVRLSAEVENTVTCIVSIYV